MSTLLEGKTVIITGAASGMGRAGAALFAEHGAQVVVADLNASGAKETVTQIEAAGGRAAAFTYDATSAEETAALVAFTKDTYGRIDSAWANAGLPAPFMALEDHDESLFDRLMAVNVKGPWLLAKYAAGALEESHGSFLITASMSGLRARAHFSGYQASKGGAVMLTRSLAKELAPRGVRVNSVCPVATATPMLSQFVSAETAELMDEEGLKAGIPMGRLATAEDIANAALFFVSDLSTFVTGVNLPVDGGASA